MHMPPPVHGAAMVGKYIHDSRVINEAFDCHYLNLTLARDLSDIGKGGVRKLADFIRQLHRIRKEVKRVKPDVCYVTPNAKGGAFYKDFLVVQMLKRLGCRIVVHYHNKGVATRQDRILDDFLYRRFFKGLKVILLAESLYDDVKKYVDRKEVFICPNGIPETLHEEPSTERHNEVPLLLFLSNLLVSKGVLVLLDACRILKDRGYSFVCNFIGGETYEMNARQFEEEVVKRGLNRVAIYQGKKYGADKSDALNSADVFVFPTYYDNECFPIVLLEAMQSGLPCISTAEGGIREIIDDGKTGYITERRNAAELADRIACLIDCPEVRGEMGRRGHKKYREQFTLPIFENRLKEILSECI